MQTLGQPGRLRPSLSLPLLSLCVWSPRARVAQGDKPVVQRMLYEFEWDVNVAIESAQGNALSQAIDPVLLRASRRLSKAWQRASREFSRLSLSTSSRSSDARSVPSAALSQRPRSCIAIAPADPPSCAPVAVALASALTPELPQSHSSGAAAVTEETLCEASVTAERQQDAENMFIIADTSGDGVVDEDELCVLCANLMARQGQPQSVSDEALRKYLRKFRASPSTPLKLDFDQFAGVYNSFLVAQRNGDL